MQGPPGPPGLPGEKVWTYKYFMIILFCNTTQEPWSYVLSIIPPPTPPPRAVATQQVEETLKTEPW